MPYRDKITGKRDYKREYAAYKERRKANPEHDEHCRKSNLARSMKFYWNNKEKLSLKNHPKRKKYNDEYRIKNSEILKIKHNTYYKNRDKIKHRAYYRKYTRDRCKEDICFRIIRIQRTRVYQILKGHIKSAPTLKLLGVPSLKFLWQHLERQFQSGMTKENYGKWHVDHIIPCASFDFSDPEQQKKCFHYTNLQPLWASDNIRKGKKIISGDITSPKM